jgi:beta-galactosidase/beta-glucuronidase
MSYPDQHTRKIVEWFEAMAEIKEGDNATLSRLLKEADTKTLVGVFESYDGMLEDHRNHPDVAFWSAWDEEGMRAVRRELRRRGVVPSLEGELGEMMEQAMNKKHTAKH